MTEDDTYRRLKRSSFPEVKEQVSRAEKTFDAFFAVLRRHSWTTPEWIQALEDESVERRKV
jgi:hypothetical protein